MKIIEWTKYDEDNDECQERVELTEDEEKIYSILAKYLPDYLNGAEYDWDSSIEAHCNMTKELSLLIKKKNKE